MAIGKTGRTGRRRRRSPAASAKDGEGRLSCLARNGATGPRGRKSTARRCGVARTGPDQVQNGCGRPAWKRQRCHTRPATEPPPRDPGGREFERTRPRPSGRPRCSVPKKAATRANPEPRRPPPPVSAPWFKVREPRAPQPSGLEASRALPGEYTRFVVVADRAEISRIPHRRPCGENGRRRPGVRAGAEMPAETGTNLPHGDRQLDPTPGRCGVSPQKGSAETPARPQGKKLWGPVLKI
jgi:hypothetical protein